MTADRYELDERTVIILEYLQDPTLKTLLSLRIFLFFFYEFLEGFGNRCVGSFKSENANVAGKFVFFMEF